MAWLQVLLVAVCLTWMNCQDRGVQMRLTEKGMFYAVDVGIQIMKEDMKKNVINERGKSGNLEYNVKNLRITKADFGHYELTPVSGTGMRGLISGISINANGKLWYKYKKGWLIKISDTIGISLETKNIHVKLTLDIGADKGGRPTIALSSCSAGVSEIKLSFHGGASFLYNLFSKIIAGKLKDSFGSMLCSMAVKEINTRAKSELATFPVLKKINKWAEIDYRLTASPSFTSEYMDAYLKGEFKSSSHPVESKLVIPSFKTSSDHSKMIYFWVTDYPINTAGEVFHNSGQLAKTFSAWDKKVPSQLRSVLNTAKFALLFPKLESKYPNAPMSVDIYSYKAPSVKIEPGNLTLMLYAHATFKVKTAQSKIVDAFSVKFDITTEVNVKTKNDNIAGKIISFDYDAKVDKSYVGKLLIPLDSSFVKFLLEHTVINKANPILEKGFPLPKVNEISFNKFDIMLGKDVIRIGSDIHYVKKKE